MASDKIIQFLESRLRDNPKSLLFARLADCYLEKDRVDEAIQLCREGLKNHPSYVTANFILSKAYLIKKNFEKAETELKKVISYDRQFIAAHKLLGDLMIKMGWENKAALHYREALRNDPMNHEFRQIVNRYSFENELFDESSSEKTIQTKTHPHPYRPDRDQEETTVSDMGVPETNVSETEVDLDAMDKSIKEDKTATDSQDRVALPDNADEPSLEEQATALEQPEISGAEDSGPAIDQIEKETDTESLKEVSEPANEPEASTTGNDISSQLAEEIVESELELPEESLTDTCESLPSSSESGFIEERPPQKLSEPPLNSNETPFANSLDSPYRKTTDEEEPLQKQIHDVLNHTPEEEPKDQDDSFEFSEQSFSTFVDQAAKEKDDVNGFEAPEAIMDETSDAALEQAVVNALEPFTSSDEPPLESTTPETPLSDEGESLFEIPSDSQNLEEFGGITGTDADLPQTPDSKIVDEAVESGILHPEEPSENEQLEEDLSLDLPKEEKDQAQSPPLQDNVVESEETSESLSLQAEAELITEQLESTTQDSQFLKTDKDLSEPLKSESLSIDAEEVQEAAEQAVEEIVESLAGDQEKPAIQKEETPPMEPIVPLVEEKGSILGEETAEPQQEKQEPERKERVVIFSETEEPESTPEPETESVSEPSQAAEPSPPEPKPPPKPELKDKISEPPVKEEPKTIEKSQEEKLKPEPEKIKTEESKSKTKKTKIVSPTLGEIYAAQGQYEKAIGVYKTLLEKKPNEEKYKDKISELEMKMKQAK